MNGSSITSSAFVGVGEKIDGPVELSGVARGLGKEAFAEFASFCFFAGMEGGRDEGRGGGEKELLATIRSVTGVKMKSLNERDKSKDGLSFSASPLKSCVEGDQTSSSSFKAESVATPTPATPTDREAVDEGFRSSELKLLVDDAASSPKSSPKAGTASKALPLAQPPTPLLLPLLESRGA